MLFYIEFINGKANIDRFNTRYDFELKRGQEYQKIFGKCTFENDAVLKVSDRNTEKVVFVGYHLKG